VLPTSTSNTTFASSKIRRLDHTLVANPPPKVGTTSRVRATDGQEPVDPPRRARFASEDDERARAAFAHYAGAAPGTAGAAMPPGLAVLALADLGALEGCDAELVGRYIAESLADEIDDDSPVTYARFKTMCEVIEGRRAAGTLGNPRDGEMELVPPELLHSVAMRALFDVYAVDVGDDTAGDTVDTAGDTTNTNRSARLMTMEAWNGMLLDAGLLAPAGEDLRQTTRAPGALTLAGACVAFARARGPTRSRDAAIAHSPDFFAGLGLVARASGVSVGEISCRLLALGPDPHRPSVGKLSSEDYGASVGFRDDPREAFGADAFEADVDDLASTGLSTPDVTRGTRPIFGATDRREAIERARACFRCADVGHRGLARLEDLPVILGQAGGFDHLDLNAAAVWMESRLGSLSKQQGNVVKYNQFDDEVTLTDVGRHLRAALRYPPPKGTTALGSPVAVNEETVKPEDLAAVGNVFERFCAAGAESGFIDDDGSSPPHPRLMDIRRWALCARNACVFDVGFERGAEAIAFARACPPGNHRLDFSRFLRAVGYVARQKGLNAHDAVQWFKRAKVSMRPVPKLAEFSVNANPGSHSGVTLAAARGFSSNDSKDDSSSDSKASSAASSSGENSPKNANAAPKKSAALPSSFTATRKAPRADSLRPAVADPASAERVIAAYLNDEINPLVASQLPMVLADIGAFEGLCPNRAGAAVHGAKVSLQLHGDDARVGRDAVVRASMILDELRRSKNHRTLAAPLKPAPARSLKTYEDNPSLRGTYREFATHGMEAEERDRVLRRLDATWQRALTDADADASLLDEPPPSWPKQGSIPRREGVKGAPLQSSCPCGNPRCSSTTHPHATWPIEAGNPAKPFHPNPVPYQGRELPDRRQMFAEVKPTSLGPDSREVAFLTAVGRRKNFVEARTARLFEPPEPKIDPTTGRTVDGFTYAEARLKIKEEYSRTESSAAGDRPGTATVPGAAARAAASKQRELLAASRAELEGLDPTERAGREATERGSSSAIASRRARLASAAELAAETAAKRRDVPSSQRCGMSLDNFRKLCAESGVLGDAFTPSAVDVVFARSRAPGSNAMSWGEFLRSVGYVSELRGEKFGIVANKLMAVGKPRTHYAETTREKEAASGVTAAREGARRGVRMIKPWAENLRKPRVGNRGELEPMDTGWGHLTGVLTHPVLETPTPRAPEENPRRLKPGALGRSGTRMPKLGMKEFLDSCEASHRAVVARLRRETAAAEAAADEARDAKRREFHLREREMMERATRRTNAKDPWHFVKDLETLDRAGYTVDGDPLMIGMADTMPSGVHTLTLGKERSTTWDERGDRLGATWLMHTGAGRRELPFGVTVAAARAVARSDPNVPLVAERDVRGADAHAQRRVDALVHGTVGARGPGRAGAGAGEEVGWASTGKSLRSTGGSFFREDRGFDSRGGRVAGVPALSAAAVRRTLDGRDRRVDPMASLVRRMREEGAVGGSSAH